MATSMKTPQGENEIGELYSGSFLFLGITLAVLGIIAIAGSVLFTFGTVVVLGVLLIAAGIVEIVQVSRMRHAQDKKRTLLNVLSAIVYLITGAVLLWHPVAGALGLTLLISIFLLVSGVINLVHGIRHRRESQWGWFIFGGIVDLILGALIFMGWPATGLWVIGLFVGIEMLIYGSSWIGLSVSLRRIGTRRGV
jgi:uncharacterized membrane protein HdeD (DUF308 family)